MTPDHDVRHLSLAPTDSEQVAPRAFYDQSWALVIGISDYQDQHAQLANARNDAEAIAKLLKEVHHFEHVTLLCDAEATHDAILGWLRDQLPSQVGSNDRFVFFFAGHGVSRTGNAGQVRGYLIPQDAQIGKYASYIDMEEVRNACGWIRAKHIFLILDCCFSGIAAVTTRSTHPAQDEQVTEAYLQRITTLSAWQVLTAGASDELVADSGSRPGHSPFTGAVLSGLEGWADDDGDGIITASDLAEHVRKMVSQESASGRTRQFPYFNYLMGSGQGDFVFKRPTQPLPRPVAQPEQADPVDKPAIPQEVRRWQGLLLRGVAGLRRHWLWLLSTAVLLTVGGWGVTTLYKRGVITQLGNSEHSVALAAVEVARRWGWLSDGSLRDADLRHTALRQADLQGADLQDANLLGADLQGANLQDANLRGADLRGTDLQGVHLQDADLRGANLQDANLFGTDLQGANLLDADLSMAKYDATTQWPIDFDYRNTGAIGPEADLQRAGDLAIYVDGLLPPWEEAGWSWSYGTIADLYHPAAHSGTSAIAVTHTEAWGALSLYTASPVNTAGYAFIEFWVYGGGLAGSTLVLSSGDDPADFFEFTASPNVWTHYKAPLAELGNPAQIERLNWQDASGAAQPTYYVDDIRLVAASTPPVSPDATPDSSRSWVPGPTGVAVVSNGRLCSTLRRVILVSHQQDFA